MKQDGELLNYNQGKKINDLSFFLFSLIALTIFFSCNFRFIIGGFLSSIFWSEF